jgi:hypothetical protein
MREERRHGIDDLGRTILRPRLAASHPMIMVTAIIVSNGIVVRAYQTRAAGPIVDGVWIVARTGSKLGDKWYCVSSGWTAILWSSRRGKRYRIRRLHQGFRYRQRWLRSPRSDACSFGAFRVRANSSEPAMRPLDPITRVRQIAPRPVVYRLDASSVNLNSAAFDGDGILWSPGRTASTAASIRGAERSRCSRLRG